MLPIENKNSGNIIIIGVGNSYRCDDAAGLIVAQQLKNNNPYNVTIMEKDNNGLSLMDDWSHQQRVIIVDAVSSGSDAGSIFLFNLLSQQIPPEKFRFSTHNISLPDAIQLAKQLNRLPAELRLFAIEGRLFDYGVSVTPEVAASSRTLVNEIIDLCHQWLADASRAIRMSLNRNGNA